MAVSLKRLALCLHARDGMTSLERVWRMRMAAAVVVVEAASTTFILAC